MTRKLAKQKIRITKARKYLLFVLASLAIITFAVALIPIETLETDSCSSGGQTVRLSLLFDGRSRLEQAKLEDKESDRKIDEWHRNNPGFAMGCSIGPVYKLYLF